jgi:agmatinase
MGSINKETLDLIESGVAAGDDTGIFGTYTTYNEASLVLYPVRWEATTSYGGGTAEGPDAILEASRQMDLEDACFDRPYRSGIFLDKGRNEVLDLNTKAAKLVESIRNHQEEGASVKDDIKQVNLFSDRVNQIVYEDTSKIAKQNKLVGVVGGDHSCPYGFIKYLAETHSEFGILHFDAHLDLRDAFEGFQHSHASIMYNVLSSFPQVKKLVSIGIRDYSFLEKDFCKRNPSRVRVLTDRDYFRHKQKGMLLSQIAEGLFEDLPEKVYVSFDIDGLDQRFCPSTGTPVPGGLEFNEVNYLLEELAIRDKKIIGFDLCEVAKPSHPSEWDGNVASRILYKLCGSFLYSQGLVGLCESF